ncbi:hypothetical protein KEM56_007011 [Ascosphaera pollenicola]|nr:hypothetical protein KEM56_007011 [Ascosphaera pollenicola]
MPALAAPALAAASVAYLNARLGLGTDFNLIRALLMSFTRRIIRERRDRLNGFYVLEEYAQSSYRDKVFLVFGGKSYTFHDVYSMTKRYGNYFRQVHNVQPGEIVAMDMMNSDAFVFVWLGLWSIGATPAFINYNLAKASLVHSVKVSTARLLIVEDEVYHKSFTSEDLDQFAKPDFLEKGGALEVVVYDKALEQRMQQTEPKRAPDSCRQGQAGYDTAMLIYTSGTTGMPKPAIMSWQKVYVGGGFVNRWMGVNNSDRIYSCMPLYHSTAAVLGFSAALVHGATYIVGRRFSARRFWAEVRETDATIVQYVGETMRFLLAAPPAYDPVTNENLDKKNKVRMIYGNGLRPDIWEKVKERFGIETVCEFYASTEGMSGAWNKSSNSFSAGAIGRNGFLGNLALSFSTVVVKVDIETEDPWRHPKTGFCERVPRGEPGELLYKINAENTKESFQGYLNNKSATEKKIMHNVFTKGDAYFRTGDMVRWDKEGRWYFSDRLGDTFRWRSENVSTSEVAHVIGSHSAVHESNVYGIRLPHHEGRAGCAYLVFEEQIAAEGSPETATQKEADSTYKTPIMRPSSDVLKSLAAHASANLPKYAVPLFLRVTRTMEPTGTLKQQKVALRNEGADLDLMAEKKIDDLWYWLRDGKYVEFRKGDWEEMKGGRVRL